ncbi:hypothetical protein N5J26_19625 [Pseudomonas sp. GD03696]|nr:hypothetical protein [Pseudomonas sp. GD03696]MDH1931511.1 hypothetical protein [Pseudomonas sp. GD03696]
MAFTEAPEERTLFFTQGFFELIGEYTSLKCYSFSLRSTQISKGLACKGYGLALLWVEIQVGSFRMRH